MATKMASIKSASGDRKVARALWLLATTSLAGAASLAPGVFDPARAACEINDVGKSTRSVTNSRTINCININNTTVTRGGVTNTGDITGSATPTASILVNNNSSVAGGITNSGEITHGVAVIGSTVSGGITNYGAVTGSATPTPGILINNNSSVTGGITNSGEITHGVAVNGSTFAGGITNDGAISANFNGILIKDAPTFSGAIVNTSSIAGSSGDGIRISHVSTYSGGIDNENAGSITGLVGIVAAHTNPIEIFDSGTIIGTSGVAIDLSKNTPRPPLLQGGKVAGNEFTLGPQYDIVGDVLGSGVDLFQLGGTSGTGKFNLSNIGAGQQYQGFATFDVLRRTWIVTGTGNESWTIKTGKLQLGNGGTSGSITGNVTDNGIFAIDRSDAYTFGGPISGTGSVQQIGSGTLILSASNPYSGPTNVNAGTLDVTGSIANSRLTTVTNGASLIGTGKVGAVLINSGGTLAPGAAGAPGTSLTVAGNLALASGAIYLVRVNPTTASFTNVSGTAALAGSVNAQFAAGSYVSKQYTILTANGGLGGTSFAGLTNTNLPSGTSDSLSYDPDHVYLNLRPGFTQYTGLAINEQNVANALSNYFNTTGGIPSAFFSLTPNGLMQVDGEVAVDSEFAAFELMDEFLQLMLDPFVDGRLGSGAGIGGGGGGQAMSFAPDQQAFLPSDIALAYAGVLKAAAPPPFVQRWTAWGASYGGGEWTNGNAAVGSSNVTAQTFGFAAGMDYHYSPDTIFGFALGGGGTNWGLNMGGTGRSDAFQTGVYGITRSGPAYLAAALAFANHWMTTNRAALGDELTASFDAQSYGGRVEAGYRYAVLPRLGFGVTPYAALQAQDFHTPSYSETDLTGGGFGLS